MNNNDYYTLDEAAIAMNEAYQAYVRAGFDESQALAIVLNIVGASNQCKCQCSNNNGKETR